MDRFDGTNATAQARVIDGLEQLSAQLTHARELLALVARSLLQPRSATVLLDERHR